MAGPRPPISCSRWSSTGGTKRAGCGRQRCTRAGSRPSSTVTWRRASLKIWWRRSMPNSPRRPAAVPVQDDSAGCGDFGLVELRRAGRACGWPLQRKLPGLGSHRRAGQPGEPRRQALCPRSGARQGAVGQERRAGGRKLLTTHPAPSRESRHGRQAVSRACLNEVLLNAKGRPDQAAFYILRLRRERSSRPFRISP
jgi:hypothetical protein